MIMQAETTIELFHQRLYRLRTERGLSQRDLSMPGITYAYISRLEKGTRTPSIKAIRKLALKLGVSPYYLETGREPPLEDELADLKRQVDTLLENEVLREVPYRYRFRCGCCFDTSETIEEPLCPIHREPANMRINFLYKCGCYFQANSDRPPPNYCPTHKAEVNTWSMGK